MKSFLYFIEGMSGSPSREAVVQMTGLEYAFPAGMPFTPRRVVGGAMGAGILAVCGDGHDLNYDPNTQNWVRISEKVWLGYSKERALHPSAADLLRRERSLDGHMVTLGDGHVWAIPTVRFLNGDTRLPRVLVVGKDGCVEYQIRAEYQPLVAAADKIIDSAIRGGEPSTPEQLLWFAAAALAVNYRVGVHELSALQLIDTENIRQIAEAALDGPALAQLMDELKKKEAEPSTCGPASATGVNA